MRALILLTAVGVFLAGCATYLPITYQEQCAQKGMSLAGLTSSTGSAVATTLNGRLVMANSSGEAVSCVVPQKPEEACKINQLSQEAAPKVEYNSNVKGYRLLTGIGYYFLVLPGVGMKLYSDSQRDKALAESNQIAEQNKNQCGPLSPDNLKAGN